MRFQSVNILIILRSFQFLFQQALILLWPEFNTFIIAVIHDQTAIIIGYYQREHLENFRFYQVLLLETCYGETVF